MRTRALAAFLADPPVVCRCPECGAAGKRHSTLDGWQLTFLVAGSRPVPPAIPETRHG